MSSPDHRPSSARHQRLVVPVVVLVCLLAVSAALFAMSRGGEGPRTPSSAASSSASADPLAALARRAEGDPLALGRTDAPVVLVAYSEFQCPYCGAFARDTEPELVKDYVDTGRLRIEWRDFPYLGKESFVAAHAARAAARQDRFWEFHRALFADQPKPNTGAMTVQRLTSVAEGIGLDPTRFAADLASAETEQAVQKDLSEGQQIGVNGTPSFLVNRQPIIGAQPIEVFRNAIDDALEQAGSTP